MIKKIKKYPMRNAGAWAALIIYLVGQATYGIWWASGATKDILRHDKEISEFQQERSGMNKLTERIVKLEVQTDQVLDTLGRIERRLDRPRRE